MTNVISKITTPDGTQTIGGSPFDGQWVESSFRLLNAVTIAASGSQTVDLSSYLPDTDHRWEVILEVRASTSSTSGNSIRILIGSGSSGNGYYREWACRTRSGSTETVGGMANIVVNKDDASLTIQNTDTSAAATSVTVYAVYYRCLGWNEHSTASQTQIENIKLPDGTSIPFGGDNFDGQWYSYNNTELALLSSATLNASTTTSVDISSYIPNDGYAYELLIRGYCRTGTTSGNTARIRIGTGSDNHILMWSITRTASYRTVAGNCMLPISANQRTIYIYNGGNAAATNITIQITGIKRVGKNITSGSYIESITTPDGTTTPFGGKITDGQWANKRTTVISAVQFNDSATTNHDYTVTDYLPTNNEWYEILASTYGATGSTSGNVVNWGLYCTSQPLGGVSQQGMYINTRSSSTQVGRNNQLLIGRQDASGNLVVRIRNYGTVQTGSNNVYFSGYRRLGTNV